MNRTHIFMLFAAALLLTGCVSRDQADQKLAKACKAAINVILPEGQSVGEIKNVVAQGSPVGVDFRSITIETITVDGWLEEEYSYDCIFQESFSMLNMGYTASIYQAKTEDRMIGKSGNELIGSTEEFTKLVDAVGKALYD